MERIPLSIFVDHALTSGPSRLKIVRSFKDHRHGDVTDFYKPLRAAIVASHERGSPDLLDEMLVDQHDSRKRAIFPGLVASYRCFLQTSPGLWFPPPRTLLPIGDLEIEMAPELGLAIGGVPHVITLRFDGDPPAKRRVNVTLSLLSAAFASSHVGAVFAMLDVKTGRLHMLKGPVRHPQIALFCRAEAAALSVAYAAI